MILGDYEGAIDIWEQAKQALISRRNTEITTETADLETAILIDNFLSLGYQGGLREGRSGDRFSRQTIRATRVKQRFSGEGSQYPSKSPPQAR